MKLKTDWNSIALAAMSLPNDEAGKLLKLLCTHINGGIVENGNTAAYAMFGILRNGIDAEMQKARHISEVNAANGRKGGAPIGNTYAVKTSENKRKQAKTSDRLNGKTSEKQAKTSENKRPLEDIQTAENQTVTVEITPETTKEVPNIYNIDNIDIYNTTDIDTEDIEVVGTTSAAEKIDVAKFADFFNGTMTAANAVIPKITKIEGKRKTALLARLREHGRQSLGTVVKNAAASDFLNGKNNRAWVANFDWIFKPSNFVKVLDGNYANHAPQASSQGTTATPRYPVSKEGITLNSLMQVLSKNGQSTGNYNTDPNGADTFSPTY